jgi:hypothetical protein
MWSTPWRVGYAALLVVLAVLALPAADDPAPSRDELLKNAAEQLVKMQEQDGSWAYEGVYRVGGEIPVGYRIGGTAIVAGALLHAVPDDPAAKAAIAKAVPFILKQLEDPRMTPSTREGYDVRVWGHGTALEFFCHLRSAKATGEHAKAIDAWVPKLVETLVSEEINGGGWNYATRQRQASFVTAPIAQALLLARGQGENVPAEVLDRAREALEKSRATDGAFAYSGPAANGKTRDKVPGSAARAAACEVTLVLLGGGSNDAIRASLDIFHDNWDELKKRYQQTGTHVGPYSIAPYYFYYGHRYAAQAIQLLPEKDRAKERDRLLVVILRTREKDGTWNDRVFARSRGYGTAVVVLALLGDKTPLPPKYQSK